ncbi:hypothetical protein Dret_1850 [Desulfohalobium retbaense DSM 5692]|uniref:Uncharacterized protein n=1 Tax=Desulfohalobium retbaense (strain ATCC 49708 / DSM 5692 / JCM 16813 / HR100) TaxID=485915 RepID=C8X3Y7_DESRD|nr:hypothetical protein Dret_1850 [Desulfohalobium retbaense DSM 5692]
MCLQPVSEEVGQAGGNRGGAGIDSRRSGERGAILLPDTKYSSLFGRQRRPLFCKRRVKIGRKRYAAQRGYRPRGGFARFVDGICNCSPNLPPRRACGSRVSQARQKDEFGEQFI